MVKAANQTCPSAADFNPTFQFTVNGKTQDFIDHVITYLGSTSTIGRAALAVLLMDVNQPKGQWTQGNIVVPSGANELATTRNIRNVSTTTAFLVKRHC